MCYTFWTWSYWLRSNRRVLHFFDLILLASLEQTCLTLFGLGPAGFYLLFSFSGRFIYQQFILFYVEIFYYLLLEVLFTSRSFCFMLKSFILFFWEVLFNSHSFCFVMKSFIFFFAIVSNC